MSVRFFGCCFLSLPFDTYTVFQHVDFSFYTQFPNRPASPPLPECVTARSVKTTLH
jgi:hypothetical protein